MRHKLWSLWYRYRPYLHLYIDLGWLFELKTTIMTRNNKARAIDYTVFGIKICGKYFEIGLYGTDDQRFYKFIDKKGEK